MHSKFVIWEIFQKLSQGNYTFSKLQQVVSQESIYIDLIKRYLKSKGQYRTVFAADLNLDWFDNNIFGLSLFGSENYIILDADKLPESVVERLQSAGDNIDSSLVLIASTDLKLDSFTTLEIVAPNFWEQDRLLDFFFRFCKLNVSPSAKQYVLDYMEPGPLSFYQLALMLQNFFGDQLIELNQLQPILEKNKLDRFEFASLLSQKKVGEFYRRLAQVQVDDKSLRGFFIFMQSHLYKILDPSYIKKKAKLSKYDREIQAAATQWNAAEIDQQLENFRQLEQASKINISKVTGLIQSMALATRSPSPALP